MSISQIKPYNIRNRQINYTIILRTNYIYLSRLVKIKLMKITCKFVFPYKMSLLCIINNFLFIFRYRLLRLIVECQPSAAGGLCFWQEVIGKRIIFQIKKKIVYVIMVTVWEQFWKWYCIWPLAELFFFVNSSVDANFMKKILFAGGYQILILFYCLIAGWTFFFLIYSVSLIFVLFESKKT